MSYFEYCQEMERREKRDRDYENNILLNSDRYKRELNYYQKVNNSNIILNGMKTCEHGGVQYLIISEDRYLCYECTINHYNYKLREKMGDYNRTTLEANIVLKCLPDNPIYHIIKIDEIMER